LADPAAAGALTAGHDDAMALSARSDSDVARLRAWLIDFFERGAVEAEITLGWDRQDLRSELFERCQVLSEVSDERGVTFRARAQPEEIDRLRTLAAARRAVLPSRR
jgi:hypothetical protein